MTANNLGLQNWLRIQGGHAQLKIMFIEFFTPENSGQGPPRSSGQAQSNRSGFLGALCVAHVGSCSRYLQ